MLKNNYKLFRGYDIPIREFIMISPGLHWIEQPQFFIPVCTDSHRGREISSRLFQCQVISVSSINNVLRNPNKCLILYQAICVETREVYNHLNRENLPMHQYLRLIGNIIDTENF